MDDNAQMVEARRVIALLIRACRQTQTFFDGISVMDQARIRKLLREAIRQSEHFLGEP